MSTRRRDSSDIREVPLPRILADQALYALQRCGEVAGVLLDETLAPLELDRRGFGVLSILAHMGSMKQSAVRERIGVDRTSMVKLVDGLEEQAYVKRRYRRGATRARSIGITRAGRAMQRRAAVVVRSAEHAHLRRLSEEERNQLRDLLRRLMPERRTVFEELQDHA